MSLGIRDSTVFHKIFDSYWYYQIILLMSKKMCWSKAEVKKIYIFKFLLWSWVLSDKNHFPTCKDGAPIELVSYLPDTSNKKGSLRPHTNHMQKFLKQPSLYSFSLLPLSSSPHLHLICYLKIGYLYPIWKLCLHNLLENKSRIRYLRKLYDTAVWEFFLV